MAFIYLTRDLFENSSVLLRPAVHFISSSAGITGSAQVSAIEFLNTGSSGIRDIIKPGKTGTGRHDNSKTGSLLINSPGYDEGDFEIIELIRTAGARINQIRAQGLSSADISGFMSRYLEAVGDAPVSRRYEKTIDVFRFDPPVTKFQKNSSIKNNIRKVLMPYHRTQYANSEFSYTNYNSLNFFTGSIFPTASCLMYPNHTKDDRSYIYSPKGPFTFDFWINPRYKMNQGEDYKAGTIFHMSSSIALSLITGSHQDGQGRINKFRLLLQLSHSADYPPSSFNPDALTNTFPQDLVYATADNTLSYNNWHHVTVRWGGTAIDNGTGSITIDDTNKTFHIPSSSLLNTAGSDIVFMGNFYDGPNANLPMFFNSKAEEHEGVTDWNDGGAGTQDPDESTYNLSHPLNAEIHDVKLYNKFLFSKQVLSIRNNGPTGYGNGLIFYVPPLFQAETRRRLVLQTPFQKIMATTDDPFNVAFSFGVGGKLINLENFTREFVSGEFPRLFHLTASEINQTIENITADQYVYGTIPESKLSLAGVSYASGSTLKRNFTLLPNDNGLFRPNYFPIDSGSKALKKVFLTPGGGYDYSTISLENLVPSSSLFEGLVFQAGSIFDQIVGASPENPGVAPGAVLTIAQRTRDLSSNEIVVFDISNLYYGNRIQPGSFTAVDSDLTGSRGKIKLTFKDNGVGGLYRGDCLTTQAKWANFGNLFYDEGIAIVKTPHAFYFAKDKTNLKFNGEHNIHVMTINAFCPKGMINSSSNPQYKLISSSLDANDSNSKFVYITGINVHDDNLNVIMRANLAQPVMKKEEDGFLFKIKKDF